MDLELVFPKFIRLNKEDEHSTLIRRGDPQYNKWDGNCYATYYRPCGEWSCKIYYKKYTYYMTFVGMMPTGFTNDPFKNAKVIEIDVSTPQEFLEDNGYCISEATAKMFKEAWDCLPDDIKDHQEIFAEKNEDGTHICFGHKEYYKNINYKYEGFE